MRIFESLTRRAARASRVVTVEAAEVLDHFLNSPEGQKAAIGADEKKYEARRALVDEKARLIARGEELGPGFASKNEIAQQAMRRAHDEYKKAERNFVRTEDEWRSFSLSISQGVYRIDRELERTADPAINRLLYWIHDCMETARHAPLVTYQMPTGWGQPRILVSEPSIKFEPLPQLQREALALRCLALPRQELEKRILDIVARAPAGSVAKPFSLTEAD